MSTTVKKEMKKEKNEKMKNKEKEEGRRKIQSEMPYDDVRRQRIRTCTHEHLTVRVERLQVWRRHRDVVGARIKFD